jgi:hypothetical protein
MNDERFERDLGAVLREIAGEDAPMYLRSRLAKISEEAPIGRRLWFLSPMNLAAGAVVVVAVVALAVVLMPRQSVGPVAGASPTVSASASPASPTPTVGPSATPTVGPSATPTVGPTARPTVKPTPTPAPAVTTWTAIAWSAPFDPLPVQVPADTSQPATSTEIMDMIAWHGGYVGVGSIDQGFQCGNAAFLHSDDGVVWTVAQKSSSGDEQNSTMCPAFVVPTANGLVAMGERRLWSSTDGAHWTEIDSPSWRALWTAGLPQLIQVASGPGGMVAIGTDLGSHRSIVAHSVDGHTWKRVDLPASGVPTVRDVAAYAGGFVAVGRDGKLDEDAGPTHPAIVPGVGRPAAWTSPDGVTWTAAKVEGSRVQGGGLTRVLVGADGLFAIGNDTANDYYPDADYSQGHSLTAWASADGTSWKIAGTLGTDLPPMGGLMASDGTRMVAFGLRQPDVGQQPTAWTSTDGSHWTALTVSGKAPDVALLGTDPEPTGSAPDSGIWMFGDRLLVLGSGDGVPTDEPYANQWFRFGTIRQAGG